MPTTTLDRPTKAKRYRVATESGEVRGEYRTFVDAWRWAQVAVIFAPLCGREAARLIVQRWNPKTGQWA